jgi:sec-independent protein translocase protein TatA
VRLTPYQGRCVTVEGAIKEYHMLGLPRGAEWIVILVIVLLLFGPGRIGRIAGELGKGIKAFRDGLGAKTEDQDSTDANGNIEPK